MNQNLPYFLIENEEFPKSYLKETFDDASYNYLIEHEYIKVRNQSASFKFVGVVSIGTDLICILPKYFEGVELSNSEKLEKFRTIIRVLKKNTKYELLPDINHTQQVEGLVSEISLADSILRDYLEFGIFEKSKVESSMNSSGEINWNQTVNLIDPILSNKRPIYHDVYNFINQTEEYNVITELHKWCIKYCLIKYGSVLGFNFSFTIDTVASYRQIGELDYLLSIVEKEIQISYLDRTMSLLKKIRSLLKRKGSPNKPAISLFGTGYFHVVWENVCSQSFKNVKDVYEHLIPKPIWHNTIGESKEADYTLNPDIVCINTSNTAFFILDAKYYNLKFQNNPYNISGMPGVGDVSKQMLYEKAFSSIKTENHYNILLFPGFIDSFMEIIGSVTFDLLLGHRVYNVLINPDQIFESYLQNETKGYDYLDYLSENINHQKI